MKRLNKNLLMGLATFVALTFVVSLTSCNKEKEETKFVGIYDLVITTDSLGTDGQWFDAEFYTQMTGKENPPQDGTLTIETTTDNQYSVVGQVKVGDTETLETYFSTTATLNEAGELVLADCTNTNSAGYELNFTFAPIKEATPLVFRSEMHTMLGSLDCGYIMTNTATKK